MEQLSAVRRKVEVKALALQIVTGAFVLFLAQEVFHGPGADRKAANA